jgi:hypothetical protein
MSADYANMYRVLKHVRYTEIFRRPVNSKYLRIAQKLTLDVYSEQSNLIQFFLIISGVGLSP